MKLGNSKTDDKEMPDAETLAAMANDNVKVGKLVHEFLAAQSLKILPQEPFGDAVTQFVDKDDKHAMDAFIIDSLATGVRELLELDDDEEDLDDAMERLREKHASEFKSGAKKLRTKGKVMKPQPDTWDSEIEGPWEDAPGAYVYVNDGDEDGNEAPKPATKRGGKKVAAASDDDDESVISTTTKKTAAKKAPAKRAPAKPKAPAKAPARGRKKVLEPSDDEDGDLIMLDDEPPPAKTQPKRAAATTSRARQTQLNFSQLQAKTQTAKELSDDEISDDDAFDPAPVSSSRRR